MTVPGLGKKLYWLVVGVMILWGVAPFSAPHLGKAHTAAAQGTLRILSPNGGEIVQQGRRHVISWLPPGVGSAKITLSIDGGVTYPLTLASSIPNVGAFPWTPAITSAACRVKVCLSGGLLPGMMCDTSDSNFAVGQLRVTSPNGGEDWPIGSSQTVRWSSEELMAAESLTIELSRDGGETFETLIGNTPNDGSEAVVVTGPTSSRCRVRIRRAGDEKFFDTSDGDFTISQAEPVEFRVQRVFPQAGAVNVPLVSDIAVGFTAPLVTASVTGQTLQVRTDDGALIDGSIVAVGTAAFFFPTRALPADTSLNLHVAGGPGGVMGLVNGQTVPLENDFVSRFTTESEAARMEPPGDGGPAVRFDVGGAVVDGAGTGAMVGVPAHTLKADTVVKIIVLDSQGRLSEVNNDCGVPLTLIPGAVSEFERVSDLVRVESQPCGAVAFSPGMDLTFPLLDAVRGTLPLGTRLRMFQLVDAEEEPVFVDTGIDADVTLPGEEPAGNFAIASGVEVFGTFALFMPLDQMTKGSVPPGLASFVHGSTQEETSPDRQQARGEEQGAADKRRLYFPVINQGAGRQTRLSLVNPDQSQDRTVTLKAYNDDGSLRGSKSLLVRRGQQTSLLVSALFRRFRSGAILAETDGALTGFYEIADDFDAPQMMDGAEAVLTPLTAAVFPIISTTDGAFVEVHLFNPDSEDAQVRVSAYQADGRRVALTPEQERVTLRAHARAVVSSAGAAGLRLPFDQLEGGYLLVQSINGRGIMGAELYGEEVMAGKNLAILNALTLPSGCRAAEAGECRSDPSVPAASRQHSTYAIHFEPGPAEKELVLINLDGRDALVALSAFDTNGQFLASQPGSGFMPLPAHKALRLSVSQVAGINISQQGGIIRVEDPFSVVVGAIVNRDSLARAFLTAFPLMPDLAQAGQEATDAFLSRIQIDANGSGHASGLFVLNPNNNLVSFKIKVTDRQGRVTESPILDVLPRGTFAQAQTSLRVLFAQATDGHVEVEAVTNSMPGTDERLMLYGVYRRQTFLSAVPAQR